MQLLMHLIKSAYCIFQGFVVRPHFICYTYIYSFDGVLAGTDDDLPPTHQNRIPRGARLAGNGRSAVGSMSYPRMYGEIDMETQIHQLEQEAYSSILRAFKAQADAITWVHFVTLFSLISKF